MRNEKMRDESEERRLCKQLISEQDQLILIKPNTSLSFQDFIGLPFKEAEIAAGFLFR